MSEIIRGFLSSAAMFISVYGFGIIVFCKKNANKKIINVLLLSVIFILLYSAVFLLLDGTIKTVVLCILYMLTYKILFNKGIGQSFLSSILYTILLIIPELLIMTILVYLLNLPKEYIYNSLAGGIILNITISIGITEYKDGKVLTEAISEADSALYHSKQTGKNIITTFDKDNVQLLKK